MGAVAAALVASMPSTLGLHFVPLLGALAFRRIVFFAAPLADIPHLLLTWWAWNASGAWQRGSVPRGIAVAILAFFVIGAALRLPASPSPLQALAWPRDYAIGLASFFGWGSSLNPSR
jgi:hypothetical protein